LVDRLSDSINQVSVELRQSKHRLIPARSKKSAGKVIPGMTKVIHIKNCSFFQKMNKTLVDSYSILPGITQHKKNFEQAYNVQVKVKNSKWIALEFSTEQDAMLAILNWS